MNRTRIDWADMTWNPVTGCLHGCKYCYARKIANRFGDHCESNGLMVVVPETMGGPYPYDFTPTLHTHRLAEPAQVKKPQTIFVCSMADLFGEWVPDAWIQTVFKACEAAPQHRYLFLTKNPERYSWIETGKSKVFNEQIWFGATVTNQAQYMKFGEDLMSGNIEHISTFLSIEPILEPINMVGIEYCANWVIIGAETGNRKGKVIPEKWWIDDIVQHCRNRTIPVFMKESLRELMGDDFIQMYPWRIL